MEKLETLKKDIKKGNSYNPSIDGSCRPTRCYDILCSFETPLQLVSYPFDYNKIIDRN